MRSINEAQTYKELIDPALEASVWFLLDGDALVDQTRPDGFEKVLPNEPYTHIYSNDIQKTNRLYAPNINFSSDQIRFLHVFQGVFPQKHCLAFAGIIKD